MDEIFTRFWTNVIGRVHGPLTFRFLFQPAVAIACAIYDGVADARKGNPPYAWAVITQPAARGRLLREGLMSVGRVVVVGALMDVAYQLIVFGWVYPGEMVFIVLMLAFVPYLLARGPANRLARLSIRDRGLVRDQGPAIKD